jgi:predicted lipoprotein with Yx(FWY)xxD motif
MKGKILTVAAVTVAASLAAGLSSASAADRLGGPSAQVSAAHSGLGQVLVDGRGRTLYLFLKDIAGKSACNQLCARYWPPLITSGRPVAKSGAKSSLLGTVRRADGRLQVTYKHHPLYTFVQDTRKGQTTGEGLDEFGGKWYVLSPAGAKVAKSSSSMPSGGYGGGGYGY